MNEYVIVAKYLWDGNSSHVRENVALAIKNGKIVKIGEPSSVTADYPAATVIGNGNLLVMPAFVDAHDHGRGVSPIAFGAWDRALEMWLQDLNKLPAIPHYEACYFDGLRLASSGVGTVLHSHNPNSFANIRKEMVDAAHGYKDAGIRSILCPLFLDQNKRIYYNRDEFIAGLPDSIREPFANGIHDKIMSMQEYLALVDGIVCDLRKEIEDGWVEVQLHPNGGQWCSDEALLQMKEYAMKHHMNIHLHLLETKYQREMAMRKWGKNFIKHYEDIGFLGPWISFAHAVYLDDEDMELVAKYGAHLITNPSSNLRLRSGTFQIHKAIEHKVQVGIGIDGCGYDDDQDYLREIRTAWLNNSVTGVDGSIDYMKVLEMATKGGASIETHKLSEGVINVGANADIVCIDSDRLYEPYADNYIDPLALLVQKGTRDYVQMTMVHGSVVWQKNEVFLDKEKKGGQKLAESIRSWRNSHPGKRDNELIIQHVHDFYKEVQ